MKDQDFNNYIKNDTWSNNGTNSGFKNPPSASIPDNGILIVCGGNVATRQILIGFYAGLFKTRIKKAGTWSNWVDII